MFINDMLSLLQWKQVMKKYLILTSIILMLAGCHQADSPAVETIVFIRHGEKADGGFGQMNCQGLNRSLALPAVLLAKFGKPNTIFATNPYERADDGTRYQPALYYYIRALAFIEPTAIQLNMPVNIDFGLYSNDNVIANALLSPTYHHSVIYFVWEHNKMVDILNAVLNQLNIHTITIPEWQSNDFDSLYVLTLDWSKQPVSVVFRQMAENLNYQSKRCPV